MLISFLVYILFGIALFGLGTVSAKKERIFLKRGKELSFWTWDVVLALLVFAFISGIRWQVGVDHLSYLKEYQSLLRGNESVKEFEVGFYLISKFFSSLNIHFTFYFASLAFLQLFFVYYAFRKERYLLPFIGILIIFGTQYLSWMNGIRQMLAATIFVFSIQFIQKKNLIPYILTILLATAFHKSAILLIVFYFIPQKDYFKNRYINIGLVILTLIIGFNPSFIYAIDFFDNILAEIGYIRYSERFDIMLEYRREMALGPRRISVLMTNFLTIWYAPKLKNVFKNTNYLIYFNFAFVGILLFNLFANTSHIFLRPISYLTIYLTLTTSYLLFYLKRKTQQGISVRFLIVFLISISYLILSIIADYGKGDMDWTNFKFFWNYV